MRWMTTRLLSAVLLSANLVFVSCDDDDDDDFIVFVDDVLVEIGGDSGVPFDGIVEDENGSRSITGTVPLEEEYLDQVGFFHIRLDKTENDAQELCVRATSTSLSRESCTTAAFGSVQVTLVF